MRSLTTRVIVRVKKLSYISLAVVIGLSQPVIVSAATETDTKAAGQGFPYFEIGEFKADTSSCSADATLRGGNNAEKIFNFLVDKGMSNVQAAGAMGNIDVESAGTFDPQLVQFGFTPERTDDPTKVSVNSNGDQGGWGIIQWTPASKVVTPNGGLMKQAGLVTPPGELGSQLNLIWWHMTDTTPPGVKNFWNEYKQIDDVAKATESYMLKMEAPGIPHLEERINRAREALRQYGGGDASSAGGSTTGSVCQDGLSGGGTATINGFTFPLLTTKAAIQKGTSLNGTTLKWCSANPSNCHHDYEAADIFVPTGTTVVAALPGRVVTAKSGNRHPNSVTVKNDDGTLSYYTHMGVNTVKLSPGKKVQGGGGTVIGKVGTSEDAMGTAAHLHFDLLPKGNNFRPDCSGAACSGYPFINVQPTLIELYKQLPEG